MDYLFPLLVNPEPTHVRHLDVNYLADILDFMKDLTASSCTTTTKERSW